MRAYTLDVVGTWESLLVPKPTLILADYKHKTNSNIQKLKNWIKFKKSNTQFLKISKNYSIDKLKEFERNNSKEIHTKSYSTFFYLWSLYYCRRISGVDPWHLKTSNCKIKVKSLGIWKGSPKLIGISHDLNVALVDDPEYLYLLYEMMHGKWLSTWNIRACKEILEHNIILNLIKRKHTYLLSTHSTKLNSKIRI